jgi:hypothetical protein
MALANLSVRDLILAIAEETTFGTPLADATAMNQLMAKPISLDFDLKQEEGTVLRGRRNDDVADHYVHSYRASPKLNLEVPIIYKSIIGDFLFSYFQNVSMGAATIYPKTFTMHATQPDFTANAGIFHTILLKNPEASKSWKLTSAIANSLDFKCGPDAFLSLVSGMQAKGIPSVVANPSGTITKPTVTGWHGSDIDRFTMDFGAGAVAQNLYGDWQLTLNQVITLLSLDGTGSFLSYGLSNRTGKFTCTLAANSSSALANMLATGGTGVKVRIGWGNATPGTVDGDLDFAFNMKIIDYKFDNNENLGVTINGKIEGDVANTVQPITIICGDSRNVTWP